MGSLQVVNEEARDTLVNSEVETSGELFRVTSVDVEDPVDSTLDVDTESG